MQPEDQVHFAGASARGARLPSGTGVASDAGKRNAVAMIVEKSEPFMMADCGGATCSEHRASSRVGLVQGDRRQKQSKQGT